MNTKLLLTLLVILMIPASTAISQELDVNVTVNMEQLTQEARVNVQTMETDVENYLNNQSFTGQEWEGPKIPVEVSIFLQGGSGNYSARLFIVSKRTLDDGGASVSLRMVDNEWSFEYSRFANLSYNPMRFHEFTTLLDYYMCMIIGMDLDTYTELGGNKMYNKARELVQLGATRGANGYSTYAMPGEFTRYNLVSEFTDLRYEDFRLLIFAYYYDGLDLMAHNEEKALEGLRGVIKDMAWFKKNKMTGPSVLLQAFFDAKSQELAMLFTGYKDKTVFDELKYLDVGHATLYDEASEK